jgi:hypothetical protein
MNQKGAEGHGVTTFLSANKTNWVSPDPGEQLVPGSRAWVKPWPPMPSVVVPSVMEASADTMKQFEPAGLKGVGRDEAGSKLIVKRKGVPGSGTKPVNSTPLNVEDVSAPLASHVTIDAAATGLATNKHRHNAENRLIIFVKPQSAECKRCSSDITRFTHVLTRA